MQSNGGMGQGHVVAKQRGARHFPMRPVVVACLLVFSGMPMAYAANCTATSASSLATCIAGASSGNTITLGANITLASVPASLASGVILNLAGYTLSTPSTGWIGSDAVHLSGGTLLNTVTSNLSSVPVDFAIGQTSTLATAADTTLTMVSGSGINLNSGAGVVFGSSTATGTIVLSATEDTIGDPTIEVAGGTLRAGNFIVGMWFLPNATAVKVDAGATLDLAGFTTSISNLLGAGTVQTGGAALTVDHGDFSGEIVGSGSLTIWNWYGGGLTLSGSSSYTGATTVYDGRYQAGATNAFSANSAFNVYSGATLDLNNYSQTIGSLANYGNVSLGSATLTAGGNNTSTSYFGVISGSGGLTKTGSGVMTLGGTNTYTGTTAVNAGTLQAGAVGAFAESSAFVVSSGATLDLNNYNQTVGSLAGAGNVTLGSATLTAGGDNTSTSYSGVISGNGGLTKTGAGTLTLSGTNTYTGATAVNAGTLRAGAAGALASGSDFTVSSGATLELNNYSQTIGTLAGAGNVNLGSATLATDGLLLASYGGVISGTGGLTKVGSGTLSLAGANTYSGTTTVSSGTLLTNATNTLSASSALVVAIGANVVLNGYDQQVASLSGAGTVSSGGWSVLTTGGNNASTNLSGNISGLVGLVKTGSGTLTLSGHTSYLGATNIGGGTVRAGAGNALAEFSAFSIASGATLDLNGFDQTIASLAGAGNVNLGWGTLTTGGDNTSTHFSGVISGLGGLVKQGSGTLTLGGSNAYYSTTTVSAGTLRAGAGGAFSGLSAFAVSSGATLDLNSYSQAVASLAGAGSVTLGSATLTAGGNNTSTSYSGVISGSGGLTKTGAGTLTLTGSNTYTGATAVNAGALQAGAVGTFASGSAVAVSSGATLDLNNYSQTVGSLTGAGNVTLGSATLTAGGNNTSTSYSGVISGSGGLTKTGAGTLTLTGSNTYSGATSIHTGTVAANAGAIHVSSTIAVDGSGTLDISSSGLTVGSLDGAGRVTLGSQNLGFAGMRNGSFSGVISGTGGLSITHGAFTQILSGVNTYSGATEINSGTLRAGASGSFSSVSAVTLVGSNARLDLDGFDQSIASLSGSDAASTVTLGSATLVLGGDNSSTRFAGGISGTGGLTKNGTGTFTVLGTSTYSGMTTVNSGSLVVNGAIAGETRIASGASLGGTGSVGSLMVGSGGILAPGSSIGTLTVHGALGFSAGSIYRVEADAAGNADRTNVVGGALTIQGGTVAVQAGAGAYARNTTYTILTSTGTTSGAFDTVTSNLAFLTPTLIYQSNAVLLKLSSSAAQSYASVAQTPTQLSVARYLDTFANAPGSTATAQLIQQLDNLGAGQALDAFDSLSGRQNLVASQVADSAGRVLQSMLMGRAAFVGEIAGSASIPGNPLKYAGVDISGLSSASSALVDHPYRLNAAAPAGSAFGWAPARSGIWTQAQGSAGQLAANGNAAGAGYRTSGVLTGYDSPMGVNNVLGVALGYSTSTWDTKGDDVAPASGRMESPMAALYGSYAAGPWQLRVSADYTDHGITALRTTVLGGTRVANASSHHGQVWGLGGEVEHVPADTAAWQLRPVLGLRYANWNEDAYAESGNVATALQVQGRHSETTTVSAGLRVLHAFEDASGQMELRSAVSYTMGADDTPVNASMGGQGGVFSIPGTSLQRTALTLGAGVVRRVGRNLDGYAESSYEIRDAGQSALSAIVGVRLVW